MAPVNKRKPEAALARIPVSPTHAQWLLIAGLCVTVDSALLAGASAAPPPIALGVRLMACGLPLLLGVAIIKPWSSLPPPPFPSATQFGGRAWVFGLTSLFALGLVGDAIIEDVPSPKPSFDIGGLLMAIMLAGCLTVFAFISALCLRGEQLSVGGSGVAVTRGGKPVGSASWENILEVEEEVSWGEITTSSLSVRTRSGEQFSVTDATMGHSGFRKARAYLLAEARLRPHVKVRHRE